MAQEEKGLTMLEKCGMFCITYFMHESLMPPNELNEVIKEFEATTGLSSAEIREVYSHIQKEALERSSPKKRGLLGFLK